MWEILLISFCSFVHSYLYLIELFKKENGYIWSHISDFNMSEISHPSLQCATQNANKYQILQKGTYRYKKRSTEGESITWSWALPFRSGRGVNSIGLPWDLNCEELCDLFCLAFLTDFRENPSTLSTDGGVVGAEDISLLKRKKYHKHISKVEEYM